MKKLLIIIFLGFICLLNAEIKSINVLELEKLIKVGIKIIDIRMPKELNETGIIPTSYRLNFYKKDGKINRDKWLNAFIRLVRDRHLKFVIVSKDGEKAKLGATLLQDLKGYKKPYYLKGGINSWILEQKKIIYIK
mgnify:CR=1 FL=1